MQQILSLLRKNKGFAVLLAAELAVLVWLFAGLFGPAYKLTLSPDVFTNEFTDIAALSEDGSALQIQNDGSFETDKEITFSSAPAALPSGAYDVTVEYFSCQTPDAPCSRLKRKASGMMISV